MYKLLLITTVLLACSCIDTPVDDGNRVTYYMDQEFIDYIIFKKGSYWVYEDTTKKEIDSIYLSYTETNLVTTSKIVNYNYESYYQRLWSSFYNDTMLGGGGANMKGAERPCYYSEKYLSNYLIDNIQFFSDKPLGYVFENNKTAYLAYHDSLKIGDKWFYSVKVFENQYKEADLQPRIIYYAKNIGVIKKEMYDGTIWQLKKYTIIR